MDYSDVFVELYRRTLVKEMELFKLSHRDIQEAIRVLKEVYLPNPQWREKDVLSVADYNDPSQRCAYLHKYATCHTGLVYEELKNAIEGSRSIETYIQSKERLGICSLGGGPGNDAVGALAAIVECFGTIPCSVSIVDYFKGWETTFKLLLKELQKKDLNSKGLSCMTSEHHHFMSKYLVADLLDGVSNNSAARQAVSEADLVTMVKFISAAACKSTRKMVKSIFANMKPGSMLLFIDNAAGGFYPNMEEIARNCGMVTAYGPHLHHEYENTKYSVNRFNYTSLSKTKVSIQIWKKPGWSVNYYFNRNLAVAQGSVTEINAPVIMQLQSKQMQPTSPPRTMDGRRVWGASMTEINAPVTRAWLQSRPIAPLQSKQIQPTSPPGTCDGRWLWGAMGVGIFVLLVYHLWKVIAAVIIAYILYRLLVVDNFE